MRSLFFLYFSELNAAPDVRVPDNCLFSQLGESTVSEDQNSGSIKLDHLSNPTYNGRCAIEVYAPKKCELGFRINSFNFNAAAWYQRAIWFRWPSGKGQSSGGPVESEWLYNDESFNNFTNTFEESGGWIKTGKDILRVDYRQEIDGSNDASQGYELQWKCFGEPDPNANLDTCRTTSSVFGEVGWHKRTGRMWKGKHSPDFQSINPVDEPDFFPNYNSSDDNSCGSTCAATAGCYFYNIDKQDVCKIVVGDKPGMRGINKPRSTKIAEAAQMNSFCGGNVRFGTGYTKQSSFYCKFQTGVENSNFVEDLKTRLNHGKWSLCPYDGLLTSSKVTVVESKQPAWSESWYGTSGGKAWYWTKFRIVTNLRTNPNLSVPPQTCIGAESKNYGLVPFYRKQKIGKCSLLKRIGGYGSWWGIGEEETVKVSTIMNGNSNPTYYKQNTQVNCASNCADTAGCTGYYWKNADCHMFLRTTSYGSYETEKDEDVEESGRMTSMCAEVPFESEFVRRSSFACKFIGDGTTTDFVADLKSSNNLSGLSTGWSLCKSRSGIRTAKYYSGLNLDKQGQSYYSNWYGDTGSYYYVRFDLYTHVRKPKVNPAVIEECDSGTTSDFGSVSFTINRESRSKCLIEQPYTYWASHSATDLGFNNRVEDCPSHCANTAGCYAYHFERTNGCLLTISSYVSQWRRRDTTGQIMQSGHMLSTCGALPFTSEFTFDSLFSCRYSTVLTGNELIEELKARNNITADADLSGKFNRIEFDGVLTKTRSIYLNTNLPSDNVRRVRRSNADEIEHRHRRQSGKQWVWISFQIRTYIRRKIGASYADLNRAADENVAFIENLTTEGTISNPDNSEVVETTEVETEVNQQDLSGSGAASASCETNDDGTIGNCVCNTGFTENDEGTCIADADQPEDDDLADALEDSNDVDAIQSGLTLPLGSTLAETTPTETEVSAVTTGEASASCPLNDDGTLGECTCNEGFSVNDSGTCVRDDPEEEDLGISDALDDQDALNAVFNADLSDLAEVIETTDVQVEISAVDSTGQESGSCPANDDGSVGECECLDGFVKDDNDDCIDQRSSTGGATTASPITTPNCELVEVDFDALFDESMNNDSGIQNLNEQARDSFLKNQRGPMKNIYKRYGKSKSKNSCIAEEAVGGLFGSRCGNAGMETGLEMCKAMVQFYEDAFANCDNFKGPDILQMQQNRCINMENRLKALQ